MRDYFKIKTWLITALMFLFALGIGSSIVYFEFASSGSIKSTQASAANNVSGWAWSANIGWISFNCTNDNPACSGTNYGVNIDAATGNFSGYAWSANAGWISFNRRTCVGGSDNGEFCAANNDCSSNNCRLDGPGAAGAPLSAPYNSPAGLEYIANYNSATGQVTGWAKILTLGDNGWIKFNGNKQDGQPWTPGVSLNLSTGEFSGWAWNDNNDGSGAGWISFNCSNETPPCGSSDYKVTGTINRAPAVAAMTAPNWNYAQASTNALHADLMFNFLDPDSGSYGSAYQIEIRRGDNNGLVLDTGICTGYNTPSADCKIDNAICMKNGADGCVNPGDCVCQFPLESELDWNSSYKWRVKVWDNYDAASALTQYNTVPDTDNDDGAVLTFTTYKHRFPVASAVWFPLQPSRGEKVKFTDTSKTFTTAAPTTEIPCDANKCDWLWTIPSGAVFVNPEGGATSTPTIIFNAAGVNDVTLRITDKIDGYWSEISLPVTVASKLPKWKEVKPE